MKRKIALFSAAAMILTLASCGEKTEKLKIDSSQLNSSQENSSIEDGITESVQLNKKEEFIPYVYNDERIQLPVDVKMLEQVVPLDGGKFGIIYQSDNVSTQLKAYITDAKFEDFALVEFEYPEECSNYDECFPSLFFNRDGSFNCYYTFRTTGDNYDVISEEHMIASYDKDGKMLNHAMLIDPPDEWFDDYGYMLVGPAVADGESLIMGGDIYKYDDNTRTDNIYRFSSDGSLSCIYSNTVDESEFMFLGINKDRDGKIMAIVPEKDSNGKPVINFRHIEGDKLGEVFYSEMNRDDFTSFYDGYGPYIMLKIGENELTGIRDDGTTDELVDKLNSGIDSSWIYYLNDTEFISLQHGLTGINLVKLTPAKKPDDDNKAILKLGVFLNDSRDATTFKNSIKRFNRQSENCIIEIVDYSPQIDSLPEYDPLTDKVDPYMEAYKSVKQQLYRDLITGEGPDIMLGLPYNEYKNLANKEIFTDMSKLMEGDSKYSTDKLLPNVVDAMRSKNGTLSGMCFSFYCESWAVKTKYWDKPSWTLQEMLDFYDNAPDSADHMYDWNLRGYVLKYMTQAMEDLIDYDNLTCNFDSPEFVSILEFCNKFIEDWETHSKDSFDENGISDNDRYYMELAHWFGDDRQLTHDVSIDRANNYGYVKNFYGNGEDITLVGFPTNKGSGGVIVPGEIIAITESCRDKQAAWEYVKSYLSEEFDINDHTFPVQQERFEQYMNNEVGALHSYSGYNPPPLTQEEVDMIKEYVYGCTTVANSFDDDLWNIITEHADEYFNGAKTAEEAAKMIQNRAAILVSEKY